MNDGSFRRADAAGTGSPLSSKMCGPVRLGSPRRFRTVPGVTVGDLIDISEARGELQYVHCKLCSETLFDLDKNYNDSKVGWLKGVILHFNVIHDIDLKIPKGFPIPGVAGGYQ